MSEKEHNTVNTPSEEKRAKIKYGILILIAFISWGVVLQLTHEGIIPKEYQTQAIIIMTILYAIVGISGYWFFFVRHHPGEFHLEFGWAD